MKKLLFAALLTLALSTGPALADVVAYTDTSSGVRLTKEVSASTPLPVTTTPTGTQDGNLKQVNGATVNVGTGAASTGTQRVTTSTDSTIGTVTAVTSITNALPAGTAILGKVGIDQTTPGTTNGVVPAGNVASGVADSGNPVKVGAVYNSTLPTLTTGQRGDLQVGTRGSLRSQVMGADGTVGAGVALNDVDGLSNSAGGALYVEPFQRSFNGATWDRTFACASSAAVNVTAGNTTQIVGLSGSTVIRVCSLALSMSAAGTAGVYTGTGTNCGTGTTTLIQDMTLATGTPLALSGAGGSVVRSSAGGEICVKAVTGNVTGVITYTQY